MVRQTERGQMKTKAYVPLGLGPILTLACFTTSADVWAQVSPRSAQYVSPEAALERVWTGGTNTEGPAVGPDGSVFFVDNPVSTRTPRPADRILRWNPVTGIAAIYRSPAGMA